MKTKVSTVALAALLFAGLPLASTSAYVAVSVGIAPPAIPIYTQPYCPGPGYIWTPGYWAYGDFGYYWVPGVWVYPPQIGFLWTPGYWGYSGGSYVFNDGYWGPTVGFYGGINYGNGYIGHGYYGGQWSGGVFRYNTAVSRVDTAVIHNTYVNREVVNQNVGSRAGFNGPGGAKAKPTKQEQAAAKAERVPATSEQRARVDAAKNDPALHAKNNKGKPNAEAVKTFDRNNGRQAAAAGSRGRRSGSKLVLGSTLALRSSLVLQNTPVLRRLRVKPLRRRNIRSRASADKTDGSPPVNHRRQNTRARPPKKSPQHRLRSMGNRCRINPRKREAGQAPPVASSWRPGARRAARQKEKEEARGRGVRRRAVTDGIARARTLARSGDGMQWKGCCFPAGFPFPAFATGRNVAPEMESLIPEFPLRFARRRWEKKETTRRTA